MATTITPRQPFAPLNGSRLSNLTSLKNRQNAVQTLNTPTKRKAQTYEADNTNPSYPSDNDSENIDPLFSPKRSKTSPSTSEYIKPSITNFFLTRAPTPTSNDISIKKSIATPRRLLTARSPIKKSTGVSIDTSRAINTGAHSAPAGRSPTRKRIGLLSRRRNTTRVDPPSFGSASGGLGFSIDAALSGTIPSYQPKPLPAQSISIEQGVKEGLLPVLHTGGDKKDSWFFDIHEDTEEEFATNMMEHGACTLDISSDEETSARENDMRGKENVPPVDDVSQTRTTLTESSGQGEESLAVNVAKASSKKRRAVQEGEIEVDRSPLGDLAAEEFYPEGCDGSSVFVIIEPEPEPEAHLEVPLPEQDQGEQDVLEERVEIDIDALMQKSETPVVAALLEPLEKSEESAAGMDFEVWESGSAKGDE